MRFLILTFVMMAVSGAFAESKALPFEVTTILNHKYNGWKLIQISPEFEQSRQQTLSYADDQIRAGAARAEDFTGLERLRRDDLQPSNRIFGDFDGDGREDCAVAIKRNTPATISILAFLNTASLGYRDSLLEDVAIAADYTLLLVLKGEPMAGESPGPATDYIRVDVPNAPAHWFVMKKEKFVRLDGPPEEPAASPPDPAAPGVSTAPVETLKLP